MVRAAFATLGCKVNQYETQRILDRFEERGFAIAPWNEPADVYVLNSCSVTVAAERKSRGMIRRATRTGPGALVVMTGCAGEMAGIRGETVEHADLIVPNNRKMETLECVLNARPDLQRRLGEAATSPPADRPARRTRATLKVQDGCNIFCSFCSIPYTRRSMESRPLGELVAEAATRAAQGYREIVVTGVLVGAWVGEEDGRAIALAGLLQRLAAVPGIERVRLSSIEPTQVTEELLTAFAETPQICNHLHMPLQSGDTGTLSRMNRPYDAPFYLERCRTAQKMIADLAITSDIMVGFPGEDEAAFEATAQMVRDVGFARAHLFRYSPRPGTPAADMAGQVTDAEKEDRSRRLAAVCAGEQAAFVRRYCGRTLPVLAEGRESTAEEDMDRGSSGNDGNERVTDAGPPTGSRMMMGYTANYIRVRFAGGVGMAGSIVPVHLLDAEGDTAWGEPDSGLDYPGGSWPLPAPTMRGGMPA
ncbi:MAG: MiaB/RimO family radical SAM methylthiotransferase [Armatimonadetes bacterium]|nr:MiaB/RimO family radical SAM methylthiotransferase [Armatimonadota bacterium]MDE2206676.1 MiaB/RimO family radical SAM methylthiotransferase [Armatimonadota bacterium]